MPKQESDRRSKAVNLANAINNIEGHPVSSLAEMLSTRWAKGEITGDEMKSELLTKHYQTK